MVDSLLCAENLKDSVFGQLQLGRLAGKQCVEYLKFRFHGHRQNNLGVIGLHRCEVCHAVDHFSFLVDGVEQPSHCAGIGLEQIGGACRVS